MIHETAIISSKSVIADDVKIGPYCVIDDNVSLDSNNELVSHVYISGNTKIGKNNKFFPFSSIGTIPQDLKYSGEQSRLTIGNNNVFRENVTVNPGTKTGSMETKIENNCLFMVGTHIAHDCYIGSNVIMSNNAQLAGHVKIYDNAIIGGLCGIHQFVSIGKYSMIGGMSGVGLNIVPYGLYFGVRQKLRGLNLIGLKRKGVDKNIIKVIQKNFNNIFNTENSIIENINNLSNESKSILEIKEIIDFINTHIERGICTIE
tara:strand:- start:1326 stop:2105 length:780 start_codon:yes stop_codon:yes gene_type:complete